MQIAIMESQYQSLEQAAHDRGVSVADLVMEAVTAWLQSAARQARYARLARKQALWRAQPVALDALRLDLIYHSEALEGSSLTKEQIAQAIQSVVQQ